MNREDRAYQVLENYNIIQQKLYTVSNNINTYQVKCIDGNWSCDCPDHTNRLTICKHLYAIAGKTMIDNLDQNGYSLVKKRKRDKEKDKSTKKKRRIEENQVYVIQNNQKNHNLYQNRDKNYVFIDNNQKEHQVTDIKETDKTISFRVKELREERIVCKKQKDLIHQLGKLIEK